MIYCDIGNTSVDLLWDGIRTKRSVEDFDPSTLRGEVYYVSVNPLFNERIKGYPHWHDVRRYVRWENYYPTMGIDRVMVCEAIEEGVVVDAGSAITIDVMRGGTYQGGLISLGVKAAEEAYAKLSPALAVSFNFEVHLDKMATNTPDAVTAGFLAPLIEKIEKLGKPLYLSGGDARLLKRFLPEAIVEEDLIFQGMKKLIEKGVKC